MHYQGQCLYIDKIQRQKGFLLDPKKAKKVLEFEAKDYIGLLNKIREKNKRYKRSRSNRSQLLGSNSIEIDASDDPTPYQHYKTYAVYLLVFNNLITSSSSSYPLLYLQVLDLSTNIYIYNNPTKFIQKYLVLPNDIVLTSI